MTLTYAPQAFKLLNGVFAVYKPSFVSLQSLVKGIQQRLTNDINNMEQRPHKQMVLFKPIKNTQSDLLVSKNNDMSLKNVVTDIPYLVNDWFDHPLIQGNRFKTDDFQFYIGHELDDGSCGVQVIGIGKIGEDVLNHLNSLNLPCQYRVKGQFGITSVDHSLHTKILSRSTWDHVTVDKIDRILTIMQGAHRNACTVASGIDFSSQKAYELASRGLLKPQLQTVPVILAAKLISFNPPDFIIDVTCINECCSYLHSLIHQIALELRAGAVCTYLQRQSDGVFTHLDQHTLLTHQVNAVNISNSIQHFRNILDEKVMKSKNTVYFQQKTLNYKTISLEG